MSPRERLFALEQFGIKLGLDNIRILLDALNHPERAFRSVHVAGTNGKGSVSAMVERGLRAAGYRTGRYTSPHLAHIEERISLDGRPVASGTFDTVTAAVLRLVDELIGKGVLRHAPTFFEATTAVALEVFRQQDVQVAVVEVGLGGRFDATNVLEPTVTAITSISLDHERHLGTTLQQIAFEKAGIIKPGIPVVVAAGLPDAARATIESVAQSVAAPLIVAAEATESRGAPLTLALQGAHQHANAAVAAAILTRCAAAGLTVRREHIVTALTDVEWPARLEWVRVPNRGDVLIDAAHNPAGATALADYVTSTTGPIPLVLGLMKDKDVEAIVRAVAPAASHVIATRAAPLERALESSILARRVADVLPDRLIDEQPDPDRALTAAFGHGRRVMVAGSIFLVGPLRERLRQQGATPVRYPSETSRFLLA